MKRLLYLALALAVLTLRAADNDVAAPQWDATKTLVVKWRTSDSSGVHTPHVMPAVGAAFGASIVGSAAQEASKVIKASAGTLLSLVGYNSGAAQFVQIHNSATVPADTAVPIYSFTVPATSNFSLDVPISGMPFTTGISVCNSSTQATKTLGGTNCWFTAVIK